MYGVLVALVPANVAIERVGVTVASRNEDIYPKSIFWGGPGKRYPGTPGWGPAQDVSKQAVIQGTAEELWHHCSFVWSREGNSW